MLHITLFLAATLTASVLLTCYDDGVDVNVSMFFLCVGAMGMAYAVVLGFCV